MAKLISVNPLEIKKNLSNKPFSTRLVNWVEPIDIKGYLKTGIYTEVNSNIRVGDRVFILNGNYDSDLLIKDDKYKKGRDGYKVLEVDKCKITLDIDYTGDSIWNDDSIDSFVRVYPVRDDTEFKYVNRMLTSEGGSFGFRFDQYQDNVIYTDNDYAGTVGFGENTGLTGSPGFFIKGGTYSWTNVTSDFSTNFTSFLGTYSSSLSNERIKIMNATFTYGGMEFKEGYVYKFEDGNWVVDVTYFRPIISKANFRDGNFKGDWNAGLFGRQDKKIKWEGVDSNWNTGTLLNTIWATGSMNSVSNSNESYFADIDEYGLPFQKINQSNNKGFGYNYVIDSEIDKSLILNGNFFHSLLGTQSAAFSTVESYILSLTQSLNINILGGEFNNCSFESADIKTSEIKNSRLNNSRVIRTKSVNSHYIESLFYGSKFNSDRIMKVLAYDEWTITPDSSDTSINYIAYKFYISEDSYNRLRHKDQFYIKGALVSDNSVLNFLDRKFILNDAVYHDDRLSGKHSFEYTVVLSTSKENEYIMSGDTSVVINTNQLPSIDIITTSDHIDNLGVANGTVDTTDAYIIDSDFRSGLFETSDWNSGSNISHNYDNVIPNLSTYGGDYDISITSIGDNKLTISMPSPVSIDDDMIKVGSIVYLNSIDQVDILSNTTTLPDTYKVIDILPPRSLILEEISVTSSVISTLTASSYFTTAIDGVEVRNRYNYIHNVKVNKSNIKSGMFRRAYMKDSVVYNQSYDNRDIDFTDLPAIKDLMFTEMILRKTGNNINSGLFVYSFLTSGNDTWRDGIYYNSSWLGQTFSNGVFRESRWEDGNFQNGLFYKSNAGGGSTGAITYQSEKFQSSWRSGNIVGHFYNNRYSWINGTFNGGSFYKSGWENGTFKSGKMYLSDWFNGTFSNGVLGDVGISSTDTNFYGGIFNDGIVENANIFATNTDWIFSGSKPPRLVTWNNGIFKAGRFGANIYTEDGSDEFSESIWNGGYFNGGSFESNNAKWLNGTFNGGKFISGYGYTMSTSTYSTDYSWADGIFNGGEFGNGSGLTNSTWYTGEFNGGKFKGRVWNNGVLTSGEFEGSGTYSTISLLGTTCSNPSNFVDSFSSSYYGLWRNGTVTDVKDKFVKDKKIFTELQRAFTEKKITKKANLKNILWTTGTFSHPSGEMLNSVWLDGRFTSGTFKASSFNPYVKRNGSTQSTFNFDDNCYWENGNLDSSDFYISKWNDGKFLLGTGIGMIWKNGVANYMNAFNVFWENGTWRNGNWYGSSFTLTGDGQVTDDYIRQILFRGMSWSGTSSCHVWNIFTEDATDAPTLIDAAAAVILPPSSGPR